MINCANKTTHTRRKRTATVCGTREEIERGYWFTDKGLYLTAEWMVKVAELSKTDVAAFDAEIKKYFAYMRSGNPKRGRRNGEAVDG